MKTATLLIRLAANSENICDGTVIDRFNYFDGCTSEFRKPRYTEKTLMEISLDRVWKLGPQIIFWDGGLDSTFLICCYISQGVKFEVVTTEQHVSINKRFYKFLIEKNYPVRFLKGGLFDEDCVTAFCGIALFHPYFLKSDRDIPQISMPEHLHWHIIRYIDSLGLLDFIGLRRYSVLAFGLLYYMVGEFYRQLYGIAPGRRIEFYHNQDFTDVAFSSFFTVMKENPFDIKVIHLFERRNFIFETVGDNDYCPLTFENKVNRINNPIRGIYKNIKMKDLDIRKYL